MFVVMGATGHVGSACVEALRAAGEPVLALVHDPAKAGALEAQGCAVAVVDVRDAGALKAAFRRGRRAFLLNPPAAPTTDTDEEERATVAAILEALDGSGLEKVVVESTMGAQPGERIGDLSVLWELEQWVAASGIPHAVIRAAYYLSNWDAQLEGARAEGVIHTLFPVDFDMPMVAPADLGRVAARLLIADPDEGGFHYVEGPARASARDVADAFSAALGRPVEAVETQRDGWTDAFRALGFSEAAADAYARMTAAALDGPMPGVTETEKGTVGVEGYVRGLVEG